jgi:hypothetical protein
MLNRFWTVTALAAAFALCNISGAQDKKGSDMRSLKGAVRVSSDKLTSRASANLGEATRGIDVGAPGANDVVTDIGSLVKMLKSLGATPQEGDAGGGNKFHYVWVNNVPLIFDLIANDTFVRFYTPDKKLKSHSEIGVASVLGLMQKQNFFATWAYDAEADTINAWTGLEAKATNINALKLRLIITTEMVTKSAAECDSILVKGSKW